MVHQNSDLLASYEKDFKECVALLNEIIDDADPACMLEKNSFALDNASLLLKQMEVEAMNFMDDDSIRKRVSRRRLVNGRHFLIQLLINAISSRCPSTSLTLTRSGSRSARFRGMPRGKTSWEATITA